MDCGGAWSELTDSSVIFWPTGALGPWAHGPPKRGPRAQGPIPASSTEIGAPRWGYEATGLYGATGLRGVEKFIVFMFLIKN